MVKRPKELPSGDAIRLTGCVQECSFFQKLQLGLLSKKIKDTVVLSSWSDKGAQGRKNREIDCIILSLPLRSIFQIEVKASSNKANLNHGANQLQEGKTFFSSIIPFPSEEHWRIVSALRFGKLVEPLDACKRCEAFLISNETDLAKWWDTIASDKPTKPIQESDRNTYLTVIKYLLFQMFLQDDLITKG